MSALTRWTRDERGAALVEFAIVVPMLLVLVLAIVDFGRMMAVSGGLAAAVRDGARYAATSANPSDATQQSNIKARVINAFQAFGGPAIQTSNIAITVDNSAGNVTVAVSGYTYQPLTPVMRMIGVGTLNFSRSATFRWERSFF
ncbi:MAG TPA: TadE/TadG family type IV pilus assembly protein [Gemmatirosa sp.]